VFNHAPVLVLGIGIGIGQYYWVLGIGCLVEYRSNPKTETTDFPTKQQMRHEEHLLTWVLFSPINEGSLS